MLELEKQGHFYFKNFLRHSNESGLIFSIFSILYLAMAKKAKQVQIAISRLNIEKMDKKGHFH